jgi:IS5 family transposase
MHQQTPTGFEKYRRTTRRRQFLAELDRVLPWLGLCAVIEPFHPKSSADGERTLLHQERMLRVYVLQ